MANKKRYSFEKLANPETWRDAGLYKSPDIPEIRFKTKPGEGYESLIHAFEDAPRRKQVLNDFERAKQNAEAESVRIDVEDELGILRQEISKLKNHFDSLERLSINLNLGGKGPIESTVPKFAVNGPLQDNLAVAASMQIVGIAVTSAVNRNRWAIRESDLDQVVKTLAGKKLMLSHSQHVRDVVGVVTHAWRDRDRVRFKATLSDREIEEKIKSKLLDAVSIQILPLKFTCSKCGAETRDNRGNIIHDFTECGEDAHEWAENPSSLELSVVASPAYSDTTFEAVT